MNVGYIYIKSSDPSKSIHVRAYENGKVTFLHYGTTHVIPPDLVDKKCKILFSIGYESLNPQSTANPTPVLKVWKQNFTLVRYRFDRLP